MPDRPSDVHSAGPAFPEHAPTSRRRYTSPPWSARIDPLDQSIDCARGLLGRVARLRVGGLARSGEQPLAASERHRTRVADVAAVLGRAALDGDDVTDLHRVARPALAHQAVRAAHLEAPVR